MLSCVEHENSFITSGPGHERVHSNRVIVLNQSVDTNL